jgi:hypothetical protein
LSKLWRKANLISTNSLAKSRIKRDQRGAGENNLMISSLKYDLPGLTLNELNFDEDQRMSQNSPRLIDEDLNNSNLLSKGISEDQLDKIIER